jgi:GT2 family glycosyltransferase
MEELAVTREVSGVTAACAMIRASDFAEAGGFSRRFPGNYNDVDLCLKVRDRGLTVLVTGDARWYHFESKTRDATVLPSESAALSERWAARLQRDEYSRDQER